MCADALVRLVNMISSIRKGTSIRIAWFSRSGESLMIEWNVTSSVERQDAGERKFLVQMKKWFESKDEIFTAHLVPLRLSGRSGKMAKLDSWGMRDHSLFTWKWEAKSISTAAGRYRRTGDVWQWQEILIDKQRAICMGRSIVVSSRFLGYFIRGNRSLKDISCSLFIVFSVSNDEHWYARMNKRRNLLDVPNEILLMIMKCLAMVDALCLFVGISERLISTHTLNMTCLRLELLPERIYSLDERALATLCRNVWPHSRHHITQLIVDGHRRILRSRCVAREENSFSCSSRELTNESHTRSACLFSSVPCRWRRSLPPSQRTNYQSDHRYER